MVSPHRLSSLADTLTDVAGALRGTASAPPAGIVLFDNLASDSDDELASVPAPTKALAQPTGLPLFDKNKLQWRAVDLAEWAMDPDSASAFVRHNGDERPLDAGVLEQTTELTSTEYEHLQSNLVKYVTAGSDATGYRVLNV